MQQVSFTLTGGPQEVTKVFPLNNNNVDFQVSVQAEPIGGASYSVLGSLKNPQSYQPLTPYFPVGSGRLTESDSINQDVINDPCAALIFSLPAGATGSVTFTVLQQGLR